MHVIEHYSEEDFHILTASSLETLLENFPQLSKNLHYRMTEFCANVLILTGVEGSIDYVTLRGMKHSTLLPIGQYIRARGAIIINDA